MKLTKLKVALVALAATMTTSAALATEYHVRVSSPGLRAPPSALDVPVFSEFIPLSKYFGAADFDIPLPTSTSPAAVSLTATDPNVATIAGTSIHLVGVGVTTITATQMAAGGFDVGSVSTTLAVLPAAPTLGSFMNRSGTVGSSVTLSPPTSNSSGAFTFSSSDSSVASVDVSGTVRLLKAGSATITAMQAAAGNYAQSSASMTMTVTNPVQASLIGNGTSKVGACASGTVGCGTFSRSGGVNLAGVTFSGDNLTIVHNSGAASEVNFSVVPYSGKAYVELDVEPGTVNEIVIGTCAVTLRQGTTRNFELLLDFNAKVYSVYSDGGNVYSNKPMCLNSTQGLIRLNGKVTANFGQSNFRVAVPSGYRAGLF